MRAKHIQYLGRSLAALVVVCGLTVLAADTAHAQAAAATDGPCDPGLMEILEDNANAARVRDNAVAYGTIQQSDPAAGITCMDQAMAVTGRAGAIFSDRHDDLVPPANTVVFTPPLAFPDWGAGDFLLSQLNDSITPMLGVHLGNNFGGTIGSLLGMTTLSSRVTGLLDSILDPIDSITGQINSFGGQVNGILSAINTIQTLARALNLPMPSPVIIGAVGALEAAQRVADQLMGAMQQALNAAVQPLIGQVMGEVMGPAAEMDCNNMSALWGSGETDGAVALQGTGHNLGAPYLPLTTLVQGTAVHGGTGYVNQLQSGQNMEILNRALQHLTDGGLSRPGVLRSWRPAPSFGRTATPEDIINEMRVAQ